MRASSGYHNFLDGGLANQAGLASSPVGAVLELEEAFVAFGINVVGDRRSSGGNGLLQHFLKRAMKTSCFLLRKRTGPAAGTNAGPEQAFIRIDIADAMKQLLVQQCSFDGRLASFEQFNKFFKAHLKRLGTWSGKAGLLHFQPAKSPRIDKAQLSS